MSGGGTRYSRRLTGQSQLCQVRASTDAPKVARAGAIQFVFPAQAGIQRRSLDPNLRWSNGE
jgi:hypothetical protein